LKWSWQNNVFFENKILKRRLVRDSFNSIEIQTIIKRALLKKYAMLKKRDIWSPLLIPTNLNATPLHRFPNIYTSENIILLLLLLLIISSFYACLYRSATWDTLRPPRCPEPVWFTWIPKISGTRRTGVNSYRERGIRNETNWTCCFINTCRSYWIGYSTEITGSNNSLRWSWS